MHIHNIYIYIVTCFLFFTYLWYMYRNTCPRIEIHVHVSGILLSVLDHLFGIDILPENLRSATKHILLFFVQLLYIIFKLPYNYDVRINIWTHILDTLLSF